VQAEADGSLPVNTKLRSSKYLKNLIEQDHRGVKQRMAVMLGFKQLRNAAITIAGIELLHRIREGQCGLKSTGRSRPSCTYDLERGASGVKSVRRSNECLLFRAICTRAVLGRALAVRTVPSAVTRSTDRRLS
jgi:hypothetical protein